jgi:hypothetical protein
MARSKKSHFNQRSVKAGKKTAKRIKANNEVLKKFKV